MIDATKRNDQKAVPKTKTKKKMKLCLISSSGGHYEELLMLKPLEEKYDLFWVTEKVGYQSAVDYYLAQTGLKDGLMFLKMLWNCIKTVFIWIKERPQAVVTTGSMVALPACFLAKIFGKKVIFIETFARVQDCTRAGKLAYKIADLFIYQWESLEKFYPEGVYGGSIF